MNDLPLTKLALLLGARFADVVAAALIAVDTPDHGYQVTRGNVDERDIATALAAVLPDLLEWAWEEGYQASVSVIASGSLAFNPYRAHQTPTTPPRSDADAQAAHGDTPNPARPSERQE